MKLPYRKNAVIKKIKITHYLLSLTHEGGKSKAKFFRAIGFNETNVGQFEKALLKIARSNDVVETKKSEYATKYTINGSLNAPNGKKYTIKTVWALNHGRRKPHLVTAPF